MSKIAAGWNSPQSSVMSLSTHQFESEVDAQFRQFADKLRASQGFHNKGIRLCETVRKYLEWAVQNQPFSIASTHYGGSMGKGTDLKDSDFDIVMKINHRIPPFSDVLHYFQATLNEYHDQLNILQDSIKITDRSIQFKFSNKVEVDLLPATSDLTPEQILQQMKRDPIKSRYYSSSLVETQVAFMKEQSAFAHALARLAKHWYKSMECPYYVNGGSMIFELLGVAAALEQKIVRKRESMSLGFLRVLEMVENWDDMEMRFERSSGAYGPWRLGSPSNWEVELPYLLEPANSGNNILDGVYREEYKLFLRNGEVMRGRLRNLMEKRQYCGKGGEGGRFEINFWKLFKTADYRAREESESDSDSETSSESELEDDDDEFPWN